MRRPVLLIACSLLVGAAAPAISAPVVGIMLDAPSAVLHVNDEAKVRHRHRHDGTVVNVPGAYVDTRGPVEVDAPAAHVEVNHGSVHVEAPFVNLWIPR